MKILKNICLIVAVLFFASCKTTTLNKFMSENEDFLSINPENNEDVFRVLIMSDEYKVVQQQYDKNILRVDDPSGDDYFKSEIARHDKIDEAREGVVKVWLYPDAGKIMQVRFVKSTYLRELDKIIMEDIQRWNFKFPKKVVYPTKFDVRYRVVLKKNISDDAIMEEISQQEVENSN
jgi:hypothetical protein